MRLEPKHICQGMHEEKWQEILDDLEGRTLGEIIQWMISAIQEVHD